MSVLLLIVLCGTASLFWGGSAWGCKAVISCVLASRNREPVCPPRCTVVGYCRVYKCGWLAAAELMALVPGLEGAGNL